MLRALFLQLVTALLCYGTLDAEYLAVAVPHGASVSLLVLRYVSVCLVFCCFSFCHLLSSVYLSLCFVVWACHFLHSFL